MMWACSMMHIGFFVYFSSTMSYDRSSEGSCADQPLVRLRPTIEGATGFGSKTTTTMPFVGKASL